MHLFEIAPVFLPVRSKLPEERRLLTAVMGEFRTEHWGARAENTFYTIKGVAEQVLQQFGIADYGFAPVEHPTFHPYRAAAVTVRQGEEDHVAGIVGEINAEVSAAFDVDQRAMALVLNLHNLVAQARATPEFAPPSRHPAGVQDLAIVLDAEIPAERVVEEVREAGGDLLESVDLFDVYQGPQVPDGKRSLAYTLTFRAPGSHPQRRRGEHHPQPHHRQAAGVTPSHIAIDSVHVQPKPVLRHCGIHGPCVVISAGERRH